MHYHMDNIVYACILSHLCWKSPERACFRVGGDGMVEPDTQLCGEQWWDVWARHYIILDHFQKYTKLCTNWEHLPSMENGVVIGRNIMGSDVVGSWCKKVLQEKRRGFEGVARDYLKRLLPGKERYCEGIKLLLLLSIICDDKPQWLTDMQL